MILGIGIDSIEINRFENWYSYPHTSLTKIFHPHEIDYCLSNQHKSAERFAVRFAAKEAFLKAISVYANKEPLSLITVCKNVSIINSERGEPHLAIEWKNLFKYLTIEPELVKTHVSLTHSKIAAIAFIVIETAGQII